MSHTKDCNCNKTKNRKKGKTYNLVVIWLATALIIVATLLIAPYTLSKTRNTATVKIPDGTTIETLQDTLEKYFEKQFSDRVISLIKSRNVDFSKRVGSYEIKAGMSPIAAMRKLTSGGRTPIRLTFNHFRTIESIANAVALKTNLSAEEILKAATDTAILNKYGLTKEQAIALFVEDTYEVYWNNTPKKILEKIGKNYNELWNEANLARAKELGLTPAEIMTIASIVDEETNQEDEKGHIGQLYINRLTNGMPLQADPTVRYAVGNFSIQRITKDHLNTESPYNTYKIKGLPPGPIRTTSQKTVETILFAIPTSDLYMCAREDFSGYHNFAKTYDEHVKNALRYQHELDRRGIH